MKVFGPDSSELMEVTGLSRKGNELIVKGTIMGSLPMTAVVRPEEARKCLSLLNPGLVWFLLTFLLRPGRSRSAGASAHS
jgi:hypothetical protein